MWVAAVSPLAPSLPFRLWRLSRGFASGAFLASFAYCASLAGFASCALKLASASRPGRPPRGPRAGSSARLPSGLARPSLFPEANPTKSSGGAFAAKLLSEVKTNAAQDLF